jgi:hypothetical protein
MRTPPSEVCTENAGLLPMLWIRDILVRIRIRGSGTSWYGSGSADPGHFGTDPDTEPALFVSGFQNVNKKKGVFCLLLFEGLQR